MMKTILRTLIVLLMLLCLLVLAPSGSVTALAEIIEIPMDAKQGVEPWPEGYVSDLEYEDPSIHVMLEKGRFERTNYVAAHIKIAHASQIRSVMASPYNRPATMLGTSIAKSVKSVLAINGDYYAARNNIGFVARQGNVFRKKCDNVEEKSKRRYDVLIIDDKGDLHILQQATNADIDAFEGVIVNGYTFGPGLIVNGQPQSDYVDMDNGALTHAQRMCIAQVGELEYLCVCSEGPEDPYSTGLTLEQFTDLLCSFEGVQNAYNLDGGSSSTMVFKKGKLPYEKINSPDNTKRRPLYDMLYFASAYRPD